ncbi:DUF805 domain-containing protein [Celeribacter baekdonensis]|jgi:uncharacterized membrane protein YhaH (DUF805 family)|uniref:DUF805 domain-containing protein n=1 Tax=Celeribacter baekdonensis B30 TaxID=1208323 RepID=K2JZM2_9RHOB|nr:DUF805 domain-containing protein [Celeribacter baekdonensis]EKE70710.1 hypothetical protein B30_11942 [Celeribacter baekdonensis B30]
MTFLTAIKTCFSKYITFSGRASRSEYWYFALFTLLATFGTLALDIVLASNLGLPPIFYTVTSIAIILPSLSVLVRRLHDVNKSGWWYFICFVPLVGVLLILYWAVSKGTSGPNRFGPDPITGEEAPLSYTDSAIPPVNRGE